MLRKANLLLALKFVLLAIGAAPGQEGSPLVRGPIAEPAIRLGSLDQMAISLPGPFYPASRRGPRFPGIFVVQVDWDLQKGKVVRAKAISGFPGFRKYVEDAAFKARFQRKEMEGSPLIVRGTLTYRYPAKGRAPSVSREPEALPIVVSGIVNGRALELPKPLAPDHKFEGKIKVRIVVDMNGSVIDASAVNGPSSLASASEATARLAKFSPTEYCCGPPIYIVAYVLYSFGGNSK